LVVGQGGVGEKEGGDEVEGWTTRRRVDARWSGQGGSDEVEDRTARRRAATRWDDEEEQRSGDVVNRAWRGRAGAVANGQGICGAAASRSGRWEEDARGERGG
jgi:hypothetical protein